MNSLVKIVIIAALSFVLANILKGVHVDNFWTALVFAFVLAILNVFAKPVLIILTFPITLVTFGFFLLVVNTLIVLLASKFVEGFSIDGFWWGFLFSFILTLVMSVIDKEAKKDKTTDY